jgi:hypothetical protein
VGKAKRGSFKNTGPDNLLAPVLKHLVQTTPQIKPELYGDVVIGTVLPPGAQVRRGFFFKANVIVLVANWGWSRSTGDQRSYIAWWSLCRVPLRCALLLSSPVSPISSRAPPSTVSARLASRPSPMLPRPSRYALKPRFARRGVTTAGESYISNVAYRIASDQAGYYDIGIAGGVESMSSNSMDRWDGGINQEALQHPSAKGCYLNMGQVMRMHIPELDNRNLKTLALELSVLTHMRPFPRTT